MVHRTSSNRNSLVIISALVSAAARRQKPPPIQQLGLSRRSIDIFSLISSAFGGCSRPALVGAMVPWIGMMGSTSTSAGSPPISPAKSRIGRLTRATAWFRPLCCARRIFRLRNTRIAAYYVAHPPAQELRNSRSDGLSGPV
jgi:hypothetical protein